MPLSALTSTKARTGPEFTLRYNLYRCAQINGSAAPGYSSSQALKALEETFATTMPAEMGYDYMGMSYQEKKAAEGVSLYLLTLQLRAIIEMSLLRELGFPARAIDEILERTKRYAEIEHFRSLASSGAGE